MLRILTLSCVATAAVLAVEDAPAKCGKTVGADGDKVTGVACKYFERPSCVNKLDNTTKNETMANYAMTKKWCESHINQTWVPGSGHTGESRFQKTTKADNKGASCYALEGVPRPPHYKLPMCKMYNENSCCAPIHDAETQWAYETLIDVADRCLQYVNEEHFALREFFCITCDPDQKNYMSMTEPGSSVGAGGFERDDTGEIRICQHFADRMWASGSKNGEEYDMCGFSIFTDDHGVIPYGDVHPASGDDPILPSKYWTDDAATEDGANRMAEGRNDVGKGKAYEAFMNTIKPGMLDYFQFRVVTGTGLDGNCFMGAGAAQLAPQVFLAVLAVCVAGLFGQ